ncbi:MAG TPA: NAD(P)-dependent oxidoreductase [Caldilineaceae bacterium]|nr:NAD(P)-dependent oxidoreductase [Caldilineaceae bacterium]
MQILITGGDSRLARRLAASLAGDHTVRLFDRSFGAAAVGEAGAGPFQQATGDLRNPEEARAALEGIDAVIHAVPYLAGRERSTDAMTALDEATRGAYVLFNAARDQGVDRFILLSTLDLFDRLPAHWRVNEEWRPRPAPDLEQLCPWLSELSVRENSRVGAMQSICLRLGRVVDNETAARLPFDPRWVHEADVAQGVRCALRYAGDRRPDWAIFHLMAPGPHAKLRLTHAASAQDRFGYQPVHEFRGHSSSETAAPPVDARLSWREQLAPQPRPTIRTRPIYRVVIFGAGGPMGAVAAQELLSSYTLRITDVRPIAEIAAEAKPQAPGAPLPVPLEPPHENQVVDVRDPAQVMAACDGMDAIINCTVVRPDPVNAFLVNTLGAYNVMAAAVAHRIRRVVHTGPLVQHLSGWGDYRWDYDLPADAPGRPYDQLYIHSKYLGQEIGRVFADYYGLEVPVLLFFSLNNPTLPVASHPFMISWPDTGRALRRALEVTALPSPFELMNISADLPHGRYDHEKARRILNWTPRDGLEAFWQDLPAQEPSPNDKRIP